MIHAARSAWRAAREVDPRCHLFYAREYLWQARAAWQDAPPDRAALAPWLARPGRALDVGCGTGRNSVWLAQAGWQVVGLDLYPWAIQRARRAALCAAVTDRVELITGAASELSTLAPRSFDLALDVLGPASDLRARDLRAYGRDLARLVAPGGTVLVFTFLTPDELGGLQTSLRIRSVKSVEAGHWYELEPHASA